MARKTQRIVIDAPGRDRGKVFLLREMPVRQAEWWGARLLGAIVHAGIEVPDSVVQSGLAGIASLGVQFVLGALGNPEIKPLLDEMFDACIAFIPNPHQPSVVLGVGGIGPMAEDTIEELNTLILLRREALLLHVGFLPAGVHSSLSAILRGVSSPNT